MKIPFRQTRRDQKEHNPSFSWLSRLRMCFAFVIMAPFVVLVGLFIFLYMLFEHFALFVDDTSENSSDLQSRLKAALGLPPSDFQAFDIHVPGPVFRGSRNDLEWLADGLREANVSCYVRRVFPWAVKGLETFDLSKAEDLSLADAFKDSRAYLIKQAIKASHRAKNPKEWGRTVSSIRRHGNGNQRRPRRVE